MKHLTLTVLLAACTTGRPAPPPADLARETAALLRLHESDREAHLKTDVDRLQRASPDEFVAVSDGKIHRTTKAKERQSFTEYFRGASYHEYADLEPPIVRVSHDGSMAWMITRLRVRRTQKDAAGREQEERFVYAGIMTYEKRDGRWMRVANVSTFEPGD